MEFYANVESEDGQQFQIFSSTKMINTSMKNGAGSTPGRQELRTSDEHHCNRIDDDTFEIVELGLQVKRVPG